MSTEENKALVRRFVTQIFQNLDETALDELVTEDFKAHSIPGAANGPGALRDAMERVRKGLSQVRIRIDDLIAEGDKVVARLTAHACQSGEFMGLPASNKEYEAPEMHLFTCQNGRITEHWAVVDFLGIMKQLGAVPSAPARKLPTRSRRSDRQQPV